MYCALQSSFKLHAWALEGFLSVISCDHQIKPAFAPETLAFSFRSFWHDFKRGAKKYCWNAVMLGAKLVLSHLGPVLVSPAPALTSRIRLWTVGTSSGSKSPAALGSIGTQTYTSKTQGVNISILNLCFCQRNPTSASILIALHA